MLRLCMAEIESNEPHGHLKLGTADLRQGLYHLFCCFYASKALFEFGKDALGGNFRQLQEECETFEIQRTLFTIADRLRVAEEAFNNAYGIKPNEAETETGVLQRDITKPSEERLTFREACNKIIHAKKINFDVAEHGFEAGEGYLNPWIFIYGKDQDKKDWRAKLDIQPFVNLGAFFCREVGRQLIA